MFFFDVINAIIKADKIAFLYFNQIFHNPFFDIIIPFLRVAVFWLPLYLFLILFVFINVKFRVAAYWFLCFLLVISCCDIVSSHIIKQLVYRMRPCYDPFWVGRVRHLTSYCSRSSSFTSSHACNHFGMSFFLYSSLKSYFKKQGWWFFVWAFVVSYAQVYVGVHYPLDILCGAILGLSISALFVRFFYKIAALNTFQKN